MNFLKAGMYKLPEYMQLRQAVESNALPAVATGLSGIHKATIINALVQDTNKTALLLASDEAEAQRICQDLTSMGLRSFIYPTRDFTFRNVESASREYEHQRIQVLSRILKHDCDIVIACMDAALQYTIPPNELEGRMIELKKGQTVSLEQVVQSLVRCGYVRAEQIDGTGQFAVRGGILDFFTPDAPYPVRIEFWGDEIDTMGLFDLESQRRTETVHSVILTPSVEVLVDHPSELADKIEKHASSLRGKTAPKAKEILQMECDQLRNGRHFHCADKYITMLYDRTATLMDYFSVEDTLVFVSEFHKGKERIRTTQWQWAEDVKEYLEEGVLCRGLDTYSGDWIYIQSQLEKRSTVCLEAFARGTYEVPVRTLLNITARQLSVWGGSIALLEEDLQAMQSSGLTCIVLGGTEKTASNIAADLKEKGLSVVYMPDLSEIPDKGIIITKGALSAGMEFPAAGFGIITHGRHTGKAAAKKRKNKHAQELYSLAELTVGDYIVHASHGIGVFEGIHKINMQGVVKDYIKVRYAKKDTLYVPVTQLDLVSKYIGPREDATIKLSKLGGQDWQKTKARVRSAVKDIAKELIRLYAQRMQAKGHAFSPDTEWQRDFEAHFEFEETEDQLRCIREIKHDMELSSPMDRLLCGDVGFGKTEVALRAAFKCVSDSCQCALLVPTTILAWQHYQNISKRMEGFPVRIELLSRFRTPKQQEDILKRLKRGEIDMIVGTHRLVSKDVQFHNLGLLIVDEEQRFGVAQKERLKDSYKNVDVLTLSATPIPRTLNMALSGIRDMSVIEEAPHDRHPVQTYVLEHDQGIICDAIRRELRRGGQAYYLHNNVESIERVAASLQHQIPEAKVGFAHGKMTESELSEIWRKLLEQEIDVLVCTTIIETGVDVPNVNTLIIENADCMGLSQLHQIRGRVGRSSRRAYAYFTFTRNKILTEVAQKRLSAIREFTEFGSGFKIAMRDLEIRGAGNILGGEQHGHMETVGYDLYLKMLGEAVKMEKGELPAAPVDNECLVDMQVQAHIPERYIENLSQRLDIYRRIAGIKTQDDALDVLDELTDRFGKPPASVQGLIDIALLRNMASQIGIFEVKQRDDYIILYREPMNMEFLEPLIKILKGRVKLSAGNKPYVSVKVTGKESPLQTLKQVLEILISDKKNNT
ncbi:MAG: transcription-repair coupling factor [Clostridium sp.]|nr:transcription-repair coupling factor [Clostridium sp.]